MKIVSIDKIEDERVAEFHQTKESQLKHMLEPELGYFITESPLVIGRALKAGYEPVKVLREKKEDDFSKDEAEVYQLIEKFEKESANNVVAYEASHEEMSHLTGFHLMRGLLCLMKRRKQSSLQEVLEVKTSLNDKLQSGNTSDSTVDDETIHRILVLDDVENPTNVGAIFRSAAALGMDLVLVTGGSSDPLYRRSTRVSMGTVFQIPWMEVEKKVLYEELKNHGFKTVALALKHDSVSIDDETLNREEKLAIVMGNEGYGLPQETIDSCDYTALIPMKEGVDSLNVAVASGIALWQLRWKR